MIDGQSDVEGPMMTGEITDGVCRCPYCEREFRLRTGHDSRTLRCYRCGLTWNSRTGDPRRCPGCGSYAWNRPAEQCTCMVCGYAWVSRTQGRPSRCPNCKSNRWDESPRQVATPVEEADPDTAARRWVLERYASGGGCLEIASELGLPLFRVMSIVSEGTGARVTPRLRSHYVQRRGARGHHRHVGVVPSADDQDLALGQTGLPADDRGDGGLVLVHVPVGQHVQGAVPHGPGRAPVPSGPDPGVPLLYAVEDLVDGVPDHDALLARSYDVVGQVDVHRPDPQGVQEAPPVGGERHPRPLDVYEPVVLQEGQHAPDAALAYVEQPGQRLPAHASVS